MLSSEIALKNNHYYFSLTCTLRCLLHSRTCFFALLPFVLCVFCINVDCLIVMIHCCDALADMFIVGVG